MAQEAERLFGQILLKNGLVTREQLQECLAIQEQSRGIGYELPLGKILVNKGYVREDQVEQALRVQQVSRVIREDYLYGRLALKNELVTDEQLSECLEEQKHRRYKVRLGQILLAKGYLSTQQHQAVLRAQARVLEKEVVLRDTSSFRSLYGEAAVESRHATLEQVEDSLDEQARLAEAGRTKRLGDIMVERGVLSTNAAAEVADVALGRVPRSLIRGYEVIEKIAQGAMGAIYKARQLSLDRVIALKILLPSLSQDRNFLERFLQEAKLAGRLNHPNIVQVYDIGECQGNHYIAMEFVEGENMLQRVLREKRIPELEGLKITSQVARALQQAHRSGILHRDIKPENIMMTRAGQVKLLDLGLGKAANLDKQLTAAGVTLGTPAYLAPEQARDAATADIRSDVYSLGGTLYHLITGRLPYQEARTPIDMVSRHMTQPPPDARQACADISQSTARLIMKMMAKDPARRYQSPDALLTDLEKLLVLVQRAQAQKPPEPAAPAMKPRPGPLSQKETVKLKDLHPRPHVKPGLGPRKPGFSPKKPALGKGVFSGEKPPDTDEVQAGDAAEHPKRKDFKIQRKKKKKR